jgi:magnesium-protoporphyrin O-methyltransferase
MSCCQHCQAVEEIFGEGWAKGDLDNYRRNGPSQQTRVLLDTLKSQGIDGLTLLDIGGGVGAIQHKLFKLGIREAVNVDGSSAYLHVAKMEAERQGNADRVRYVHGNFVDLAPQIEPADIVTLDRVICCYPDMPALVSLSSARARKLYGLVFPRDNWWVRLGLVFFNAYFWLRRSSFRNFAHSTAAVDAVTESQGLRLLMRRNVGLLWQVAVYRRA